jgi:hypothetical protein
MLDEFVCVDMRDSFAETPDSVADRPGMDDAENGEPEHLLAKADRLPICPKCDEGAVPTPVPACLFTSSRMLFATVTNVMTALTVVGLMIPMACLSSDIATRFDGTSDHGTPLFGLAK